MGRRQNVSNKDNQQLDIPNNSMRNHGKLAKSKNLLQDLISCVVLVKRLDEPTVTEAYAEALQPLASTVRKEVCFICGDGEEKVHPVTTKEMLVLQEMVLSKQGESSTSCNVNIELKRIPWICLMCSATLDKLVTLKKEIDRITICLRSLIFIQEKIISPTLSFSSGDIAARSVDVSSLHPTGEIVTAKVEATETVDFLEAEVPSCGLLMDSEDYFEEIVVDCYEEDLKPITTKNKEFVFTDGVEESDAYVVEREGSEQADEAIDHSIEIGPVKTEEVIEDIEDPSTLGDLEKRPKRQCRIIAEQLLHNLTEKQLPADGDGNEDDEGTDFNYSSDNDTSDSDGEYGGKEVCKELYTKHKGAAGDMIEEGQPTCDKCGKCFSSASHLTRHMNNSRIHNQERDGFSNLEQPTCEKCGKCFSSTWHLTRHLNNPKVHGQQVDEVQQHLKDPLACKVCGQIFPDMETLSDHKPQHRKCEICVMEFSNEYGLKRHLPTLTHDLGIKSRKVDDNSKVTFICGTCGQDFSVLVELASHIAASHKIQQLCAPCNKEFRSVSSYNDHLLTAAHATKVGTDAGVALEKKKVVKCDKCDKCFQNRRMLLRHKIVHSRPYICETCGRQFSNISGLKYHLGTHNDKPKTVPKKANRLIAPEDKPIQCKKCDKRFADKSGMYSHLKVVHKGYRSKCDLCSKDFSSLHAMRNHRKKVHDPDLNDDKGMNNKYPRESTSCEICSRTLVGSANISRHVELKHFPNKTDCPYGCPDQFESENEWIAHLQQCNSEKMTERSKCYCFYCGAVFRSQLLRILHHLDRHKSYSCEFCERKFTRKEIVNHHVMEHEEARPFLCSKCGKRFRQKYNLDIHSTTVCGDDDDAKQELIAKRRELHRIYREKQKPYKCDLCSKRFVEERRLADHKNKLHRNETNGSCTEENNGEDNDASDGD